MPDPTEFAAQDQAARTQSGNGDLSNSERLPKPDISAEPHDVQGLFHLREDTTNNLMSEIYKYPSTAYERNLALNDTEANGLSQDPSMLGELKEGAKPSEQTMNAIGEARYTYENSSQPAKDGERGFLDRDKQYNAQQQDVGKGISSPSEAMNQELARASTSVYQIGSI